MNNLRELKKVFKRFIYLLFILLGLSMIIFLLVRVMPGDTVRMALGARAPEWVVQKAIEESHLNDPIYKQYYYWFKNIIIHGDFGTSWVTRRPVIEDIKVFFPASLEIVILCGILIVFLGIPIGVYAACTKNPWIDSIFRMITYIGISVPPFIFAVFFMVIFSGILKVLPSMGRLSYGTVSPPVVTRLFTIDALLAGDFPVFFDAVKHLIIPVVSLSLKPIVEIARFTRAGMIENEEKDYITSAISYGLPERLILYKYLLKPSVASAVTVFGLATIQLFAQAFIVESIFNWPGFSRYGMIALLNKDLNGIIAVVLVVGFLFVITNIIIDFILRFLDPRISVREGV